MGTISVTKNQYVEFSDYIDIDVEIDLSDISDEDLEEECRERGFTTLSMLNSFQTSHIKDENIRSLCSMFGLNLHTDTEDLIKHINNILK